MGINKHSFCVENLTFAYNNATVINNVSYSFAAGKFNVILGRNGSGKSTFLRLMAGLLKPQTGRISIDENDLKTLTLRQRASLFGFLAQHHAAVFPFTVSEVVLTGRVGSVNIVPTAHDRTIARNAIERVKIAHLAERQYTELSGGEQQLVMIARVLAQEAEILLLDEPTSSLDFCNQIHILETLKKLTSDGLTVICVLHDPNAAFLFGDEFVFMKEGNIVRPKNDESFENQDFLTSIFQTQLEVLHHENRIIVVPKPNLQ